MSHVDSCAMLSTGGTKTTTLVLAPHLYARTRPDTPPVPKPPTNSLEAATVPAVPAAPVLPSLAFACLKSVPLDKETAIKHMDHLRPQWQWHSTIEYLKNPPWGYLSEPVDLLGGLDQIKAKLQGDGYRSEFDFLADLDMLGRVRVRDSHFHAGSALLDLFSFKTGAEFVSISKDGVSLPEVFVQGTPSHTPGEGELLLTGLQCRGYQA